MGRGLQGSPLEPWGEVCTLPSHSRGHPNGCRLAKAHVSCLPLCCVMLKKQRKADRNVVLVKFDCMGLCTQPPRTVMWKTWTLPGPGRTEGIPIEGERDPRKENATDMDHVYTGLVFSGA
eukprot:354542-Chlamydomonas_euryale.AAC.13